MSDDSLVEMATKELAELGLSKDGPVIDSFVVRQPYAYPVYDEKYKENLTVIRNYLEKFDNLQTIGRSGMHRYNNQDHSMLSAIYAVENICKNVLTKENIWKVNTEKDYHEKHEKHEKKV